MAAKIDRHLLDAVQSMQRFEFQFGPILARQEVVGRPQGRLHHPATDPENDARPAVLAQRRVGQLEAVQVLQRNAGLPDHARQLTRGERDVDVLSATGIHRGLTRDFVFLGRAGHDRNHEDGVGINPLLGGIVGFGQGAQNGVRRLAGRKMVDHVGVELLHEINPRGTAGRDQREFLGSRSDPLGQFTGLFHDRDIRPEVGVEDGVEAHAAQGVIELPGQVGARLVAKGFAQRDAHRRRNLHHAVTRGIAQRLPHGLGLVEFKDGPHGAVGRTLTAMHTGRLGQSDVAGRGDARIEPALHEGERPDILLLLAYLEAAPALDALARIQRNAAGAVITRQLALQGRERRFADTEILGQLLQFAGPVAPAGEALVRVCAQN